MNRISQKSAHTAFVHLYSKLHLQLLRDSAFLNSTDSSSLSSKNWHVPLPSNMFKYPPPPLQQSLNNRMGKFRLAFIVIIVILVIVNVPFSGSCPRGLKMLPVPLHRIRFGGSDLWQAGGLKSHTTHNATLPQLSGGARNYLKIYKKDT